jgi:hypothetical protein
VTGEKIPVNPICYHQDKIKLPKKTIQAKLLFAHFEKPS